MHRTRRRTSLGFASLLALLPLSPAVAQSDVQVAPPTAQASVDGASPAVADPFASAQWPLSVTTDQGPVTVFEPQLEDFQGDTLKARAAVSVTLSGQQAPTFGAVWLDSRVATDRVSRTVRILDVNITKDRFPSLDPKLEQGLVVAIKSALNQNPPTLSLDQLLTMLETVQKETSAVADFQTASPAILFRDHPAVLLQYDGPARLVSASDQKGNPTGLLRVANTPFFVVLDPPAKTYYLKGGGRWFTAADPMGPFTSAATVPTGISQLADSDDYKDPQKPIAPDQLNRVEIVTATTPTELVWSDGQPQMGTIPNSGLLYVANSEADWFVTIDTQANFLLVSGRWYSAPAAAGPWTFVPPDKLPADFQKIPPNGDKGDVLACIAGTQAAKDAIADAAVPQTAEVSRSSFDQPTVNYDGDPQFQPVGDNLGCNYAINTDASVLQVGPSFYCCSGGVWYQGLAPRGPWGLCLSVPSVVYQIPAACPVYPVRYCYVYGCTPDTVYCGYLPGYVGSYVYDGCVVYGTGYYYHPWWSHHYYARPWTYGFAARYNSYVGHWGFDFGFATGSGAVWIGDGDRAWGRRQPWFGYGGYRPVLVHDEVRPNFFRAQYLTRVRPDERPFVDRPPGRDVGLARAEQRQDQYARNIYERRSDVHPTIDINHGPSRPAGGAHLPDVHRPSDNRPSERNDVLADHDGNVFRRDNDNVWQYRDQNAWKAEPVHNDPGRTEPVHNEPDGQLGGAERKPVGHDEPVVGRGVGQTPVNATVHDSGPSHVDGDSHAEHVGEPARAPTPDRGFEEVNRDYGARVSGEQRLGNYEGSPTRGESNGGGEPRGGGGEAHGGGGGGGGGGGEAHGGGADTGGGGGHASGGGNGNGGGHR